MTHNLIPHHHHESESEITEHHQEGHAHHDDEAIDLNDIFSHFIHSNDGYVILGKSQTDLKSFIHFTTIIYDDIYISELLLPPLLYISPHVYLINSSHYFSASGLRAPPVC
ncbi:MAG: hypothetical protein ACKVPJ_00020 [Chitinophagales bacterium]